MQFIRGLQSKPEVAREAAFHAGQILAHYKAFNINGTTFHEYVNSVSSKSTTAQHVGMILYYSALSLAAAATVFQNPTAMLTTAQNQARVRFPLQLDSFVAPKDLEETMVWLSHGGPCTIEGVGYLTSPTATSDCFRTVANLLQNQFGRIWKIGGALASMLHCAAGSV